MKRFSLGIIIGLVIGLLTGGGLAIADQPINPIKLIVNGKEIQCDVSPRIVNDRVLVPVRAAAETLNATVQWDGANNTVIITKTN